MFIPKNQCCGSALFSVVNQDLAIQLFTSLRIRIQGAKLMLIWKLFRLCRQKKFNFYIKNVLHVGIRLGHKILLGTNAYSMDRNQVLYINSGIGLAPGSGSALPTRIRIQESQSLRIRFHNTAKINIYLFYTHCKASQQHTCNAYNLRAST